MIDCAEVDRGLLDGSVRFTAPLVKSYAAASGSHPLSSDIADWKSVSMLSVETLTLLHAFALEAQGAIVEIGAYAGGGTLALAHAVRSSGREPVICIDRGGSLLNAWHAVPDIASAWHANLSAHGLSDHAGLIVGNTAERECTDQIHAALGGRRVGLVCIDADGFVWSHLASISDLIRPDCLVVIDDYGERDTVGEKWRRTHAAVQDGATAGALLPYGVLPFNTWFGRASAVLQSAFAALLAGEQERRAREDPMSLPPRKGLTSRSGFTPAT